MTDSRTTEGQNIGHGHVFPRPDGVRARCGGPAMCLACARDLARKNIESGSAPGARDEDDAPELTADDFKRPSAKWNAPEPSESRTTSLLLSQAARLLREYADDAHAEDVPDVLRWLAVYEGRSTEPAGGHGNPCPLCKAHNLASCECPQEDHVDSVKVQPAFYRIQHKFDKGRFNDFSTDMWDLIIPGLPLTKEAKP